jgi:hypothetical protein
MRSFVKVLKVTNCMCAMDGWMDGWMDGKNEWFLGMI